MGDPGEYSPPAVRLASEQAVTPLPERRFYLDWLRGVAVLIMIGSHTLDSWTRVADRARPEYGWANIVAGFGAPGFLFLAGVAQALAAGARMRRGATAAEAAARARRRAWQIFGLAFLFRLQSWAISGGTVTGSLLKVDILNIMGLSLVAAAILWGLGRGRSSRAALLAVAALAAAMVTPLVRSASILAPLPDTIEWYLRPAGGQTTFTLFPWAGFLLAGGALGVWLEAAGTGRAERRVIAILAGAGPAIAAAAYATSFLPPIYSETSFWTSSPTFFFIRLGVLIAALPVSYAWALLRQRGNTAGLHPSPLEQFGMASLLVYWVHVEIVYGVVSTPVHRSLAFEAALLAFVVFALLLYLFIRWLPGVLPRPALDVLRRGGFLPRTVS